jgi:HEPN domain-containing protein
MYSSDITYKEWLILAPFIAQGKMVRPRTHDIRQLITYSNNKDLIATKIIEVKGTELDSNDIISLLK